ncbi:DUF1801 domain-containing protein [Aquirufa rosea]|uniref:DUF1801 domain-containing protein n=1 Tax=Aquirufa rosea TaxID=2509241 RepID=A0A4Q1BXM7_9BACT|nr:DUF1801 domain-containing protein [Aquirufa rosea]RXK47119.1 DUF1801 domain-containing protein [Aquirufa rosea]
MSIFANNPDEYQNQLSPERQIVIAKLRQCLLENIPKGFEETMSYGMIAYVVPLSIYPSGYHCKKNEPLPFLSIASQKNFIAIYHMGLYSDESLLQWFQHEYPKYTNTRLDMGKSCIRFKKLDDIPYPLIEELVRKISVEDWIQCYESQMKK